MRKLASSFFLLFYLSATATSGQQATRPSDEESYPEAAVVDQVNVDANSVTIEQFLAIVHQKVPKFQYVVNPGPWQDHKLPSLHLRGLPLRVLMEVLRDLYSDMPSRAEEEGTPNVIWIFGVPDPTSDSPAESVQVRAFALSNAVSRQVTLNVSRGRDPHEARSKALADIMSLLESVVGRQPIKDGQVTLAVHDATETLVVTARQSQLSTIDRTISAMQTPLATDTAFLLAKQSEQLVDTETALQRARDELQALKASATRPTDKK